ncbi:MAG TPA: hypothetical protein VG269_20940, partial [Tepidisphaeraceae bacterium]|nr:hypothetical protein [Tepidisphaeraceae bacterium]
LTQAESLHHKIAAIAAKHGRGTRATYQGTSVVARVSNPCSVRTKSKGPYDWRFKHGLKTRATTE